MATLLVVDDDRSLRVLYQQELRDEGYDVITASSGEEALEKLKQHEIDLMILDIKMTGMNGLETLKEVLPKNRKLPIIINTAYPDYMDDFNSWMADAYVLKSSNLGELKSRIKGLL